MRRYRFAGLLIVVGLLFDPRPIEAQRLAAITYTVQIPAPETHLVEVTASVPTDGRPAIDLMMPVWSPGYYRVEDYAAHVRDMAVTASGRALEVERVAKNKWRVATGGASQVQLFYRVFCNGRSVTTNFVDADYAVLNGAPTFITLAEQARRRHELRIQMPAGWTEAMSGLQNLGPTAFRADDFETLVDSPILAGKLKVHEFVVDRKPHFVVASGDPAGWDADAGVRDLKIFVEENRRFWGELPYDKYLFLLMFRPGGGGLEHRNSNLSTVVARTGPKGRWASLGLLAHEFEHLYNVKRLRPIELGPFDFEKAPVTANLWISEGVTSYYSGLLMTRAGLQSTDDYLASLSSLIGTLQNAPGRLLQSVERSSLEVWQNSNSGVGPAATTVSYYDKGNVLGLLLDARIRRQTHGRRSFDDVMRLAYQRYGGDKGFTSEQFRQTAERIAGADLTEWFRRSVSSTEELDYSDLLEWYGLRFVPSGGKIEGNWKLEVRPDQTDEQKENLASWLAPSKR